MIAQTDPEPNTLLYRDEIDRAIQNVLNSGRYILGSEVQAFEHEFADVLGRVLVSEQRLVQMPSIWPSKQ